jgi:hypothetical protein
MKPIFDISKSNGFTVWESGCWNEEQHFGSGVLVAGPDGGKLNVIYDRDATRGLKHALFYAGIGELLIGSYVKDKGRKQVVDIEVVRINGLTTETVQGKPVPRYTGESLFLSRRLVEGLFKDTEKVIEELVKQVPDLPTIPDLKEIVSLAIQKSVTPPDQQRMFYGVPREPENDE